MHTCVKHGSLFGVNLVGAYFLRLIFLWRIALGMVPLFDFDMVISIYFGSHSEKPLTAFAGQALFRRKHYGIWKMCSPENLFQL